MSSGTASPKRARERRLPRQTLPCRLIIRMRPDLDNLVLGSGISQSLDRYCDSVVMPLLVIVPAALVVAGFALALSHGLYMAVLVAALLAIMGFLLSLVAFGGHPGVQVLLEERCNGGQVPRLRLNPGPPARRRA